jgi:thermitase
MPVRHTFRWPRSARLATFLLVAAAIALPLAQPTPALAADEPIRHRGSGDVSGALLVQLRPGVTSTDAADVLFRAGATELGRFDDSRVRVVSVRPAERASARRMLLADPRVERVEDDAVASAAVTPSDPYWEQQWNMRRVRGTDAWETTRGDPSVIIAIVDTGVDGRHPDLRGRMVRGWDFHNDDANPYDDDGHGTAVATTAAAAGNDGVGIAGACWRCRIMPVKVLNGSGHGTHSNIAAGIRWAAERGADVINLSLAGLSSTIVLEDAINFALRRGVVVVAAAGNAGSSRRTYPAAYPGVISVAATNNVDRLYEWSNRGSWVTLAAPGCAFSGRPHGRWAWLCGTSLSTPVVSGVAGLMRSVAPHLGRYRVSSLLGSTTQRVRISVDHGRVDAARAVRAAAALAEDTESDDADGL